MTQDPPGWERHTSQRDQALFLHNPTTDQSIWFTGWVQRTSRWYGLKYWFQPTTGRSEWELPPDPTDSGERSGELSGEPAPSAPTLSSDKIKLWKANILASKAKEAGGTAGGGSDAGGGSVEATRKRGRDEAVGSDSASSDDMEVDEDIGGEVELPAPLEVVPPQANIVVAVPRLLEDVPSVALRRENLRKDCLERFANENLKHGQMSGYSKTSRSCREEGMAKGLSGMFGRFLWVQHMRQTMALASREAHRASQLPPDPVFPSVQDTEDKLVKELVEGGRSVSQAKRVLEELAGASRRAAGKLEALLEAEFPELESQVVVLEEEVTTAQGDMRMRHVTGKGARVPGPNPNAFYKLRYIPPEGSQDRETSFAITGVHLQKTWSAYGERVEGSPSVWDPAFLRRLFCVLARYETLSATSDGYQMAFPASGFRLLRHLVSVDCECFASPLNCTLRRFCSVAYDTDKFFGSEGNFFLSEFPQGSFEANPPFVEEVMERMVDHIHYLLERASGPMSFAIIVPGWDDEACLSYQNMKRSRFARPHPGFYLTLLKGKHTYRPGMQHRQDVEEKPSNCNTFIFVLQNDWGADTWPVSTASLAGLQTELENEARIRANRN